MKEKVLQRLFAISVMLPMVVMASDSSVSLSGQVLDEVVSAQRERLATHIQNKGFGPQSPRNIDQLEGDHQGVFSVAPDYTQMNLCNIHFHKNAEHKGGEFKSYAGNGDGHGYQSGYRFSGRLSQAELAPVSQEICPSKHGGLSVGDTIEVHYVHTTAQVKPAPTLGACFSDATKNPQLRVEAQVYVLVNNKHALNFMALTEYHFKEGLYQAPNIPSNTGAPIQYAGSTAGPEYNEKGSPFQVSWSVRPKVAKVDIKSLGQWCKANDFKERYGHGVRNLIINKNFLSPITP